MTILKSNVVECGVCGERSQQVSAAFLRIPSERDLAFRLFQSFIGSSPHECPKCGYVSKTIENVSETERKFILSNAYRSLRQKLQDSKDGGASKLQLAIAEARHDGTAAVYYLLEVAGTSTDENSKECCTRAADWLLECRPKRNDSSAQALELILKTADVLRRAHRWDEAINVASEVLIKRTAQPNDTLIAKFQIQRSKCNDPGWFALTPVLQGGAVSEIRKMSMELRKDLMF